VRGQRREVASGDGRAGSGEGMTSDGSPEDVAGESQRRCLCARSGTLPESSVSATHIVSTCGTYALLSW